MKFQFQYGIYFIYAIILIVYGVAIHMVPEAWKYRLGLILVYSDPAAMGMFFMGALILLEKSQRITNSIAISPVTVEEYILGKIVSVGIISEIVGVILMLQGHTENYFWCAIGIFAGSVIFSLCGIIVGAKIESLNQYIIGTLPFEIMGFVPVILYRIGFMWNNKLMIIHPGCSVMRLIEGDTEMAVGAVASIVIWIILLFWIADISVRKMFRKSGGVKL